MWLSLEPLFAVCVLAESGQLAELHCVARAGFGLIGMLGLIGGKHRASADIALASDCARLAVLAKSWRVLSCLPLKPADQSKTV